MSTSASVAPNVRPLNGEKLISLTEAGQILPGHRGNHSVCATTVLRWIVKGCRSASGRLIHLEAIRAGSRWCTSAEALSRFTAALTDLSSGNSTPVPPTPAQQSRAAAAASTELDRLGILDRHDIKAGA